METSDIIALIYPVGKNAQVARQLIESDSRYVPARLQKRSPEYSQGAEESTQTSEGVERKDKFECTQCLKITFDDLPRCNSGFIFGSSPHSDVVLNTPGVSHAHFSLMYDEKCRLIVKDLDSVNGTRVSYDGQGGELRRQFQWIIGGHRIPDRRQSIVITPVKNISFQIIVPTHKLTPERVEKINKFRQSAANSCTLEELGLIEAGKQALIDAKPLENGDIWFRSCLGRGGSGVVNHLWDVSNSKEKVVKEARDDDELRDEIRRKRWDQEARLMGGLSHVCLTPLFLNPENLSFHKLTKQPNIVTFLDYTYDRLPHLYLEYMPGGSLSQYKDITYNETLMIMRQCLSALEYLHGLPNPIVHRDVKPCNILVKHRRENDIAIKLADFGLSRDGYDYRTFCGTDIYFAPEIFARRNKRDRKRYTLAVDVWSLGIMALRLAYGLPSSDPDRFRRRTAMKEGVDWCKKVVARLRRDVKAQPSELRRFLLDNMIVLSPGLRATASDCLQEAAKLSFSDNQNLPERGHYAYEYLEGFDEVSTPSDWPRTTVVQSPSPTIVYSADVLGNELKHYLRNYSRDPFNTLYVGSTLADEMRGNASES